MLVWLNVVVSSMRHYFREQSITILDVASLPLCFSSANSKSICCPDSTKTRLIVYWPTMLDNVSHFMINIDALELHSWLLMVPFVMLTEFLHSLPFSYVEINNQNYRMTVEKWMLMMFLGSGTSECDCGIKTLATHFTCRRSESIAWIVTQSGTIWKQN